jgi:hypothetical protein
VEVMMDTCDNDEFALFVGIAWEDLPETVSKREKKYY